MPASVNISKAYLRCQKVGTLISKVKMSGSYRRDSMWRACKLRDMFERGEVTTRMVANEFDINIRNAKAWIDVMGEFLTIYEVRRDYPTIIYGLLRD